MKEIRMWAVRHADYAALYHREPRPMDGGGWIRDAGDWEEVIYVNSTSPLFTLLEGLPAGEKTEFTLSVGAAP